MEPEDKQLCKAVTIIIVTYINTLDEIIKSLGDIQGTLPYITIVKIEVTWANRSVGP